MRKPLSAARWLLALPLLLGTTASVSAQWDETVVATWPSTGLEVISLDVEHNSLTGDDWMVLVEQVQQGVGVPVVPDNAVVFRRAGGGPGPFTWVTTIPAAIADFSGAGDRLVVSCKPFCGNDIITYDVVGSALVQVNAFASGQGADWISADGAFMVVGDGVKAQIYQWGWPTAGQWNLEKTVNHAAFDVNGPMTVAVHDFPGSRVAVIIGQPFSQVSGTIKSGRVDVYETNGFALWNQTTHWEINSLSANFGNAVDIDGNNAIVGAHRWSPSGLGQSAGLVIALKWNGSYYDINSQWTNDTTQDWMGDDVAIQGTTAVAGIPKYDGNTWPSDSQAVPDRGGALHLEDNGTLYDAPSGGFFYSLADPGGNGVPTDYGRRLCVYDGYDRLMCVTADDGVNTYVLEYRMGKTSWRWNQDLGPAGLAGTNGVPKLFGEGTLAGGEPIRVGLFSALQNTTAWLVIGLSDMSAPFKGGTLVPAPDITLPVPTSPIGEFVFSPIWPTGIPAGISTYLQYWIPDPAGPTGYAASNAISGTTP